MVFKLLKQCQASFEPLSLEVSVSSILISSSVMVVFVNTQVVTKRLELLAHFYPDLMHAQSLVYVSNLCRRFFHLSTLSCNLILLYWSPYVYGVDCIIM